MTIFRLGQIVATPGALREFVTQETDAWAYLRRHAVGDWGELGDEDREANSHALENGLRLFSRYALPDGAPIWVITEADRSVTTLLLPEEY